MVILHLIAPNKGEVIMKNLIKKYSHAWILSYFIIYLIWFFYLNQKTIDSFHAIESVIDSFIPFNEWFIIPYYMWFPYVPLAIAFFFFTSREEFYRICMFLFIGMTICLIAYSIYPTGVYFRPDLDQLGRSNVLIDLTKFIYTIDPGTNVCPSIHCFNSIGIAIAVNKCKRLQRYKIITIGSIILTSFICMSTVFVKQHSIIDFFFAVGLSALMYVIAYVPKYKRLFTILRTQVILLPIPKVNDNYVISKD